MKQNIFAPSSLVKAVIESVCKLSSTSSGFKDSIADKLHLWLAEASHGPCPSFRRRTCFASLCFDGTDVDVKGTGSHRGRQRLRSPIPDFLHVHVFLSFFHASTRVPSKFARMLSSDQRRKPGLHDFLESSVSNLLLLGCTSCPHTSQDVQTRPLRLPCNPFESPFILIMNQLSTILFKLTRRIKQAFDLGRVSVKRIDKLATLSSSVERDREACQERHKKTQVCV
jgi:hypothetical protein